MRRAEARLELETPINIAKDTLSARLEKMRTEFEVMNRAFDSAASTMETLDAQARALDIAGFVLADGRTITVLAGWYGRPDERRFLRAVAAAACRTFSVVLTPNSDRYHRDHIHVDIGPWRKCGL